MYEYRAKLDRVVDGDSMEVIIDLGFNTFRKVTLRLQDIDAAELRGNILKLGATIEEERDLAERASAYVQKTLSLTEFTVRTQKDKKGKWRRYIAEIILPNGVNLNDQLVELGLAKRV
jgi:micrococcal nuclease